MIDKRLLDAMHEYSVASVARNRVMLGLPRDHPDCRAARKRRVEALLAVDSLRKALRRADEPPPPWLYWHDDEADAAALFDAPRRLVWEWNVPRYVPCDLDGKPLPAGPA